MRTQDDHPIDENASPPPSSTQTQREVWITLSRARKVDSRIKAFLSFQVENTGRSPSCDVCNQAWVGAERDLVRFSFDAIPVILCWTGKCAVLTYGNGDGNRQGEPQQKGFHGAWSFSLRVRKLFEANTQLTLWGCWHWRTSPLGPSDWSLVIRHRRCAGNGMKPEWHLSIYSIVHTLATQGMMGRTARGTGKHWARCAYISWSFCWSCITIVHQWEQWWRLLSAIYVTPGELEQADTKNISKSQRNITKAGEGGPKLRSFCSHEAWTTTTTKNKLNSHERKQCACNQEDDAGHFACSTVAVVAVGTINLAFWQPWRVAGVLALLGGVASPDVRLANAFRVHIAAPISTGRACYFLLVLVAVFPRFGAVALVALQCISYKKKIKTEKLTVELRLMTIPLLTDSLPLHPFTPKINPIPNFPCSLSRNITSHSMKNLDFHRSLRWKMIILPHSFLFERFGECTTWKWKGQPFHSQVQKVHSPNLQQRNV